MRGHPGFTLLEIAVVAFLAAMLAAVVSVAFATTLGERRIENVVGLLKSIDAEARYRARREGVPGILRFDLEAGTITQKVVRTRAPLRPKEVRLSRPTRIEQVLVAGEDHRSGTSDLVRVAVSTNGQTPSYAVVLTEGEKKRVLLFAGLTGQVREFEDENEIEDLFRAHLGRDAR